MDCRSLTATALGRPGVALASRRSTTTQLFCYLRRACVHRPLHLSALRSRLTCAVSGLRSVRMRTGQSVSEWG